MTIERKIIKYRRQLARFPFYKERVRWCVSSTAQFMEVNNYIQSPEDYIRYNRYAYCRYNPFKYTDPNKDNYDDQCAIRMLYTLRQLGVSGKDYERWGPITTDGYIRGAKPMADWLSGNYGYPEKITDVDGFQSKYHGKQGIVFFFRGPKIWNHIDYWDGYCGTGSDFYDSSRVVKQIWFWRLK